MQKKIEALVLAVMAAIVAVLIAVGQPAAAEDDGGVIYDLYRPYGDTYCHLGDTVTFEAEVVDYLNAASIGDNGLPKEEEAEAEEGEEEPAEEIDVSQFVFQWYYCQHIAETGEIIYVPIEGANELSYTIDHVSEANLYANDELEYLLAMFPADATDLSYGNRLNISSIWFCLSLVPDYVPTNEAHAVTCDPAGEKSQGDFVAFATEESGEFAVALSDLSDPNATAGIYLATLHDGVVIAEDEFDVEDGSFTYEFDAANTYLLSWYTDSDKAVSFSYTIEGEAGEPYWFSAAELTPNGAGLNAYVDAITIRSDGEYQITVENPWVDADYASSDELVATVSDDGKIWAVAPGEATITVSQGGETVDIALTVV